MSRADDIAPWHEVNRTIIGLPGVIEMFAKRVRRAGDDTERPGWRKMRVLQSGVSA